MVSQISLDNFNYWLSNVSDANLKNELLQMQDNERMIEELFCQPLKFGVEEIRAFAGVGMNRINIYTVCQISQAIAQYFLNKVGNSTPKVIITYDARPQSQKFAELSALVLTTAGYNCSITSTSQPVPYLSFLVKELKCDLGISITGGHNGIEYNGFKILDSKGCQLDYREVFYIYQFFQKINPFDIYNSLDFSQKKAISQLDNFRLNEFIDYNFNQRIENRQDKLIVVCSSINPNDEIMPKVFDRLGVQAYFVDNSTQSGNLSNVIASDNSILFGAALLKAIEVNADLIINISADYCQIDIMVKNGDDYQYIGGNDLALMFSHYLLSTLKSTNSLSPNPIILRSIVSSFIVDKVINEYGGKVIETAPCFQNICARLEKMGEGSSFILGFEENGKFIRGNYVLSANAIFSSILICDLIASLYQNNQTPIEYLKFLCNKYGACTYKKLRLKYPGVAGAQMREYLMDAVTQCPPDLVGGARILRLINYHYKSELRSNVIEYAFVNGDKIFIRPSSTEEVVFCYLYLFGADIDRIENVVQQMFDYLVEPRS